MKIIVKKRFSVRVMGTQKLKFYDVKDEEQMIEDHMGENAIALGYAIKASEKVLVNSK